MSESWDNRYTNCFMVLLNQRHKYGDSERNESTIEMGTVPNFAINSGSTPGNRTSSISSSIVVRRHRILGRPTISKTRNLPGEGRGSRSNILLPVIQFSTKEDSDWDMILSRTDP